MLNNKKKPKDTNKPKSIKLQPHNINKPVKGLFKENIKKRKLEKV